MALVRVLPVTPERVVVALSAEGGGALTAAPPTAPSDPTAPPAAPFALVLSIAPSGDGSVSLTVLPAAPAGDVAADVRADLAPEIPPPFVYTLSDMLHFCRTLSRCEAPPVVQVTQVSLTLSPHVLPSVTLRFFREMSGCLFSSRARGLGRERRRPLGIRRASLRGGRRYTEQ